MHGGAPRGRTLLTQARAVDNLFARFDKHLTKAGYLAVGGQIPGSSPRTDATIVAAPKQRNTDAEKADIKAGKIPDGWKDKPAKLRQKDRHARWTVKFSKANHPPFPHSQDPKAPMSDRKDALRFSRRTPVLSSIAIPA